MLSPPNQKGCWEHPELVSPQVFLFSWAEPTVRKLMKFGLTAANRLKFTVSKGRLHGNTALSSCQMEPSGPRLGAASSKPAHPALGLRTELGTRFLQEQLALGTDGRLHPPLDRVPNLAAHQNHLGWLRRKEILEDAGSWAPPPPAPLNTVSTDGTQEA